MIIDARIYTDFMASWLSFRVSIVRRLGTFGWNIWRDATTGTLFFCNKKQTALL
jgi:hypothetical protein